MNLDRRPPSAFVLRILLAVSVYFIAGKLGLRFAFLNASASAIWPATGVALAMLVLWGLRLWPAIFIGAFLVNITTAGSWLTALLIAAGNTLEAVTGAWLACRFTGGRHAFRRARHVVSFWFLACMLSTVLGASIGVSSLCMTGSAHWSNFSPLWVTWWLGDAVGGFLGAALILLWSEYQRVQWTRERAMETIAIYLFVAGITFMVFNGWLANRLFYTLPALMWAAFRLGSRDTATALAMLSVISIRGTLRGTGPFVMSTRSHNEALLGLQSYLAVLAITNLTVASVVEEGKQAAAALRFAHDEMEQRVHERTALLSTANDALRVEIAERHAAEARAMAAERERGDQMRALAAFVQAAQEEERRRVARELHDDLGQRLSALKLTIHVFEHELRGGVLPGIGRLKSLVEDVDRMITEVRRISYNLRPLALDDFGLPVALEMLCKEFERVYNVSTNLRVNGSTGVPNDEQIDIALYRVAQGALSNVAKHAGASTATVSMTRGDGSVVLSVEDDGRGFDIAMLRKRREGHSGLGVIGMRERSELLGGTFSITSVPDRGTRVQVEIPVSNANAGQKDSNTHRG
jgi:signal transduction histidine kinase